MERWESHIWVRETGKQLYLGGFDFERAAASEAHDLCALKLRGRRARRLNFPLETYAAGARARRPCRTSRWSPRCAR